MLLRLTPPLRVRPLLRHHLLLHRGQRSLLMRVLGGGKPGTASAVTVTAVTYTHVRVTYALPIPHPMHVYMRLLWRYQPHLLVLPRVPSAYATSLATHLAPRVPCLLYVTSLRV